MQPKLAAPSAWTLPQKILFRFFFVYFILYCFPFPLDMIEWISPVTKPIYHFQDWWVPLAGKNLFNIPVDHVYDNIFQRTGDFSYGFVFMFSIALLAFVVTISWTILANKNASYDKLHQWFRLYIRFFLAFHLLNYGFIKVFPSQFPDATASMLVQNFGDAPPARLAWNFMGYSPTFMRFTGWMEVIAALLLLPRRTTTLGAWIAMSVLSAVVMINICFAITVKLFSIHFLAIAAILLAGEWKRLLDFFILNKTVQPSPQLQLIGHQLGKKILLAVQIGLIAWMLYVQITDAREAQREYGDKVRKPALYGVYNTEYFIKNNDTVLPLDTDSTRWKKLVIDGGGWKQSSIHFSNDTYRYYNISADTVNKTMQVQSPRDPGEYYLFNYSLPDSQRICFSGIWKKDSIKVVMKKYDLNNYRLYRTKFKWIFNY